MSPVLVEKNKDVINSTFWSITCILSSFFYLFSATSEYMPKHIQYKSQVTASQYFQAKE